MIKNYASNSPLPNIFAAIEKTLVSHGATQISRSYDGQGRTVSIEFVVRTQYGMLPIRIPAKFDEVEQIFKNEGIRYKPEQPYRAAWATVRDWIDAQMALIDWDMVKLEQVFLPYAVHKDGRTFFEVIEKTGFVLGDER